MEIEPTVTFRKIRTPAVLETDIRRRLAKEGQHVTRDVDVAGSRGPWRYVDPLLALWVHGRGRSY